MRNLKRLALEIQVLQKVYGYQNIAFSEDGDRILIKNFKLPKDKYNMTTCPILIFIPPDYDAAEITECYVGEKLRWKNGFFNKDLPHTYKGEEYSYKGYQWLCFDPTPGNPSNSGLLDFINTLRTYFTDPWKYQEL